ncbi:calcium-translocating P-type ATPase, PMCA-type [Aphanomyces invadans]|uniref:Calcium-transporting ATPase n=1 Tax=Aphanomyces invadans TaxID=157072 RepID=A0A024UND2_9STRA|nr:calcium-translocating P-type ATPase, PMCA-type [Aphanomyces invadans]ETW07814.1 calcium-translocating P-type ATPase, PMCA-type [Aphanomyces invadans]|eukprot:XP_008863907.1 calcium-translocating P-type ATPase, PMCA-type [Aphanomyces invadans]
MAPTTQELSKLVETKKEHAAAALEKVGGVEGVARSLNVTLEHGLDSKNAADLAAREAQYGKNYIEAEKPLTLFQLMWQAFNDLTIIVLTCAGTISLVLGFIPMPKSSSAAVEAAPDDSESTWIEGASILFAVLIVTFVTAINDYQKEQQFRALNAVKEDEKIKVIRNGVPAEVSKFSLVVGDIVRVDLGDIIPADGLVFDESDLKLDESAMTGESFLIKKDRKENPFLLSGTKVMEGVGKMLVVAVGENSQSGQITQLIAGKGPSTKPTSPKAASESTPLLAKTTSAAEEVPDDEHDEVVSPLQGKLDSLTMMIGSMGVYTALFVFLAMVVRFSVVKFWIHGEPWSNEFLKDYLNHFILGVTVLVVAIPEGLPLAVTIALAFSVKKMLKDNNLVRHLDACETMGSATTICSDKTGTLTTNRMTVMECYLGQHEFTSVGPLRVQASADTKDILCKCICLNSTAEILPPKHVGSQPEHTGNKTECALLQLAADLGVQYADVRKETELLRMITFSSAKKRMSVVVPLSDSKVRIFTKGASEIVLGLCTSQLHLDGTTSEFTTADKANVNSTVIEKFAEQAYRTLSLAYRDVDVTADEIKDPSQWSDDDIEKDLTCICIVGIEDPVREEVPESIRQCNRAGIVVRMVTGDNIATARSIALKCGILTPGDKSIVMEGATFRARVHDANGNFLQDEFDKIWPNLRVLARSSPKDKHTLVTGLIQSDVKAYGPQVVAVTGDGTNDAPALKKADVGFAMGICGTAVAKDASDIILMDDNFRSIVSAVKWGRNVYDSIAKFLQFQLTVNLVAITIAIVGAVFLEESPLTAIQLLWVNLIMDTFASLALATDSPTQAMLERKPYPRTMPLISGRMTKHILGQGMYQLAVLVTLAFAGDKILGIPSGRKYERESSEPSVHYTIIFNTFVFLQVFNEINARRIHDELNVFQGIFANKLYVAISVFQVVMQVVIVQFGSVVFGCHALDSTQWAICVGLGAISLPLSVVLRLIPVPVALGFEPENQPHAAHDAFVRGVTRVQTQIRVVNAFKRPLVQRRNSVLATA